MDLWQKLLLFVWLVQAQNKRQYVEVFFFLEFYFFFSYNPYARANLGMASYPENKAFGFVKSEKLLI